jgi:hypothetical protein
MKSLSLMARTTQTSTTTTNLRVMPGMMMKTQSLTKLQKSTFQKRLKLQNMKRKRVLRARLGE